MDVLLQSLVRARSDDESMRMKLRYGVYSGDQPGTRVQANELNDRRVSPRLCESTRPPSSYTVGPSSYETGYLFLYNFILCIISWVNFHVVKANSVEAPRGEVLKPTLKRQMWIGGLKRDFLQTP